MILNEGELDGVRILQPETVRAMRTDQLPPGVGPIALDPNAGFGLGFAVDVSDERGGLFYWSGVANTWFWIDPIERLIAFVWTQSDYGRPPINPLMRELVYDAVVESNRVGDESQANALTVETYDVVGSRNSASPRVATASSAAFNSSKLARKCTSSRSPLCPSCE